MADFNLAIKNNLSLATAYSNRGYVYYRKRDVACAVADYTMEIKLRPDVLAYINRGNVYRDTDQLDRAAADYAEVIKLDCFRGGISGLFRGARNDGLCL